MIKAVLPILPTFQGKLFSVDVTPKLSETNLTMRVLNDVVNTRELPATYTILEQFLPSIFKHRCFNYKKYPFSKEVRGTEIGHLFEHILLEYWCQLRSEQSKGRIKIKGVTDWNWLVDKEGTFHININCAIDDINTFREALNKTIKLTQIIMMSPIQSGSSSIHQQTLPA